MTTTPASIKSVPFGDLKAHYQQYKDTLDQAVSRVLASGHYILGKELDAFEDQFAEFLGLPEKRVIGCASGTDAIYLALLAAGVKSGDEILVVAHTAVPTICAVVKTGATPVFVDVCPDTLVMDPADLEAKITSKTKVIIPVHLYGQMVDMDQVMSFAAKHKLVVLEDCAQATGATYKGKTAGTIGDYGAFSFYPSKNLGAFGDGGAVSCNSQKAYESLKMLRNYGQSKRYYHDEFGVNSRLDEMQAAILSAQLPYVKEWNEKRRKLAALYTLLLKDLVVTPVEAKDNYHVYHLYVIQTEKREEMRTWLEEKASVQALIHYPIPAHLQKAYAYLGKKKGFLPKTEYAADRILSLPMYQGMTESEVEYICAKIKEFCQTNNISKLGSQTGSKV